MWAGQAAVVKRRRQAGPGNKTKGHIPGLGVGTLQQTM